MCREGWATGPPRTSPPPSPLGSGSLESATSASGGTWGWSRWSLSAQTWCVVKGEQQDQPEQVPHHLLWVQSHWQVHHLPVEGHGNGLDGHTVLKLGV